MKTLLTLLSALLLIAPALHAQVAPPDALVGGRSLGEWNAEFWKWLLPIHTNESPSLDPDGRFARVGQPDGPVFFVTKGPNFRFSPHRSYEVEEGKYLYLALTSLYENTLNDDPIPTVEQLQDRASEAVMLIDDLHLEIDGVAVPNLFSHRAKSPPFSIDFTEHGSLFEFNYGLPFTGLVDPIVADGYAVLVEPLPPGVHVIRWGGHVGPPVDRGSSATNTITVVAIPPARRIQELIDTVAGSDLPRLHQSSLIKMLELARASFEADDPQTGICQLRAFQSKVRSHLTKQDAALAEQLLRLAQRIIDQATAALTQPHVLPNDAMVDGKTIGEWLAEWWKWILPISTNQSPAFDPDGHLAHVGQQDGPVFFLARGINFSFVPRRAFEVPEDKHLFVPLLSLYSAGFIDGDDVPTEEELYDRVAGALSIVEELYLEIDGVVVPNLFSFRATTPVFSVDFADSDNLFSWSLGRPFPWPQDPVPASLNPVVAGGYAVLLSPLSPGTHVLRFGGRVGDPINRSSIATSAVTVVALPLTQLVQRLIVDLKGAGLPGRQVRPLLETLRKAQDAFESGHLRAGIDRLRVFQHKLRHLAQPEPELAEKLTEAAQKIIDKARAQWNRLCQEKKVKGKGNE